MYSWYVAHAPPWVRAREPHTFPNVPTLPQIFYQGKSREIVQGIMAEIHAAGLNTVRTELLHLLVVGVGGVL